MYTTYALLLLALGQVRANTVAESLRQSGGGRFRTSGDIVLLTTVLSICLNIGLIIMVLDM